jgi:hypothetical protein
VNGQLHIDQMYAFVVTDDDHTEGVVGFYSESGWLPMVGADMAMVEKLRPIAEKIAAELGKPVRLLKFTSREEIEVIGQ